MDTSIKISKERLGSQAVQSKVRVPAVSCLGNGLWNCASEVKAVIESPKKLGVPEMSKACIGKQ